MKPKDPKGDSADAVNPEPTASAADESASAEAAADRPPEALAPLDFSTFVLSLGSSAAVNLGAVPSPGESEFRKDLPAAKQIIDILSILEEKTAGNLSEAEDRLLKSLLYDLRVQFVDAQKK